MNTTYGTGAVAYRYAAPQMRASDADRDLVLAELSRHFQAGRLTSEELDERTGRALSARTLGELGSLMSDLPSEADPVAGPATAAPPGRPLRYLPVLPGIAALCALVVVGLVLADGQGGNGHPFRGVLVLLPVLLVIRILVRRRSFGSSSRRR
jgi:hypothetical protein